MSSRPRLAALLALLALAATHDLGAQCQSFLQQGEPFPTPIGDVRASTLWDPDGAGPLPIELVVSGRFSAALDPETSVAAFDGTRWGTPGLLGSPVTAVGVHNGQLHAARLTTVTIPPSTTTYVSVLNGGSWTPVGSANGVVLAIASYNGDLVVGGNFSQINGTPCNRIARRSGGTWSTLGTGVQGAVAALAVFNGSLYVGGSFSSAGGTPAGNLASWNGASWSVGPTFNGNVLAFVVRSSIAIGQSYLFAGGAFSSFALGAQTTPAARIARFEPQAALWTAVGGGLPIGTCKGLAVRPVGINGYEVAAAGSFTPANQPVHVWNGSAWSPLGSIPAISATLSVSTLAYHGGRYVVGLTDTTATGPVGLDVVRAWSGGQWSSVYGRGIVGTVNAVEPAGSDVVIGGTFATISGATVNGIARGAPGAWTALGSGVEGGTGVRALATATNGDVIAAGDFTIAGGGVANRIARWNGTAWSPLGLGMNATVHALLVLPGGDIVAAGEFTVAGAALANRIARWDGTAWLPLGAGVDGPVWALARLDDGDIVAGGEFGTAGGGTAARIARFSGGVWYALGSGCNDAVHALAVAPGGDLYVGGDFTVAGGLTTRLARWSNGVWSAAATPGFGSDRVSALLVHPSGAVRIGLSAVGGNSLFVTLGGSSFPLQEVAGNAVLDMAIADDDVVIVGDFVLAGPYVSHDVAHLEVPCPATAAPLGIGCSGLTGPLSLTTLAPAWAGATWKLRATTFAPVSFALRVLGFSALPGPIPLVLVLPGTLPGCIAFVSPDITEVLLPSAGEITIATALPLDPTLAGLQLYEQVVQFEAAPGNTIAISSSNAVRLVVGAFY